MTAKLEEIRSERPLSARSASIREVRLVGSFRDARRYVHSEPTRLEAAKTCDRRVRVGTG